MLILLLLSFAWKKRGRKRSRAVVMRTDNKLMKSNKFNRTRNNNNCLSLLSSHPERLVRLLVAIVMA